MDGQFEKAGFDHEHIFAVQSDYAYLQCATGCYDHFYYNEELVHAMFQNTVGCRIPSLLVQYCPVCGGPMDVNLRKDNNFVQDALWYENRERYSIYMQEACRGNTLLLELGVPVIIRFPFEELASQHDNITLARVNRDYVEKLVVARSFFPFRENIDKIITAILKTVNCMMLK